MYLVTKIKPLDRNSCVFLGYFSELILINLVQIAVEMNHRFCFIRNNTTELLQNRSLIAFRRNGCVSVNYILNDDLFSFEL
jgi:hypothetical protein